MTDGSRFYTLLPDPAVPEHPQNLGTGWVGVVDEHAGGVVAWCHETTAAAVINGLSATSTKGSRVTVDIQLPGDIWAGRPAVDAAAELIRIANHLLQNDRESIGCDLAGARSVYRDGEFVGTWGVVL